MLNPNEMIQAVLNIGDFITKTFGTLSKNDNNSILFIVNKIDDQLEKDLWTTTKLSGYEPDYFMLVAQTFIQNKQLYTFNDTNSDKIEKYLSDYCDYYYEQVENCMPINKVGNSDGNAMIINMFIDNNFGYFN